MKLLVASLLALAVQLSYADMYLFPFGSNNRANEKSAARANNNRLFDSQNNARGGVNWGEKNDGTAETDTLDLTKLYNANNNDASQYPLVFYEGSELTLQWNGQHGCGGSDATGENNLNCNVLLQYTCDTEKAPTTTFDGTEDLMVRLRNGKDTQTPEAAGQFADAAGVRAANDGNQRGRHENEYSYALCSTRERNKGLFIADRNLQGDTSIYTRQNNNGGRSGLECPEERDYYPYWAPTIWRDVFYATTDIGNKNVDICGTVQSNSQNNNKKYRCGPINNNNYAKHNNQPACVAAGGTWEEVAAFGIPAPECKQADWSRDNHLGDGRDGTPSNYTWSLPSWTQLATTQKFYKYGADADMVKCVARIRYNITTDDYDNWNTDAAFNGAAKSPVTNNPTVDIGADLQGLKLALNTAQVGRTFQDRSHVFFIKKRPAALAGKRVVNLNVKGKRGNIVQTYPSVEYDFVPSTVRVKPTDYVHVQWTGSNTHNNGANAGDGQAGDDGQGQTGTDRSNLVLTLSEGENWPIALDTAADHMFKNTRCYELDMTQIGTNGNYTDCALRLATSNYFTSVAQVAAKGAINNQMNNAPASLAGGIVMQVTKQGTYTYMSSRNNNFSNRSQKGRLIVGA